MDLRRGSQRAVDKVLEVLAANKKVITTSQEIAQVGPAMDSPSHQLLLAWPRDVRCGDLG